MSYRVYFFLNRISYKFMDLGLYEFWHNLNSRLTIRRKLILYAPFFIYVEKSFKWLYCYCWEWGGHTWVGNTCTLYPTSESSRKNEQYRFEKTMLLILTWHLNVLFWYLRKKKKQCKAKGFHCRWFHMHVISRVLCKIHDLRVLYRNSTSRINQ